MFRWLAGRGATERAVHHVQDSMDRHLWQSVLQSLPCMRGLSAEELQRLQHQTAWILASKSFSAAHEMVLTDTIMLSIAAQAALPILNLETAVYEGWTQVIVYPGAFLVEREVMDESGVVHRFTEPLSGEAWEGGPVILSWDDVCAGAHEPTNVVIHEFAHKIDLYGGAADGMPYLTRQSGLTASQWHAALHKALADFRRELARIEAAIPPDVDPESEAADPWYGQLPLDPYAAQDAVEFFAVSSEAFFVTSQRLLDAMPDWYGALQRFYRQDPAQRQR